MVLKLFSKLGKRMDEHSENFNKEREYKKEYQTEDITLKHTITELKNILERFKNKLDKAEEQISKL